MNQKPPTKHVFGGPWTEVKLDAVQYYLECYAKALTWAEMDIWYIDAFAGTGDREATREIGGLFENLPIETITETLAGSARRALQVDPPFGHFVFIENHPERCAALEALQQETTRPVSVIRGRLTLCLRGWSANSLGFAKTSHEAGAWSF
ncbi:three-Cys-motif partner protein TcmP [Devosia chinhatensis]|uniref:Three-Cys-motif partner protein TcmP n=1 Tax=Devosia aurantiaca TaxID=2714858 RepID=A0A6M1SRJ2_9HYPH|nr:three-Cys-motif partner protein TcmP [Devosia aurantiaca]NGP19166.1 three-Cys-motif partner protein TcmP [Devosia aurantiaca]